MSQWPRKRSQQTLSTHALTERELEMELPSRRTRGRPKRSFMDAVKEDMQVVGVRAEDTKNRLKWKIVIRCGNR